MAQQQDKNWAKGLFAKNAWLDPNDAANFIGSVGILKDDFINWLDSLPVNERGFVNLSFSPNKNRDGYNFWENVPKAQAAPARAAAQPRGNGRSTAQAAGSGARQTYGGGNRGGQQRGAAAPRGRQAPAANDQATDDLPF